MRAITALLFILLVNVGFFLANSAMTDAGGDTLYNYEDSMMAGYNQGTQDNPLLIATTEDELPTNDVIIDDSGGNFFSDTFNTIKNWLFKNTGIDYALKIVNAVPNFVSSILPNSPALVFAIGFLWHALTVFLLVMFIRGDA